MRLHVASVFTYVHAHFKRSGGQLQVGLECAGDGEGTWGQRSTKCEKNVNRMGQNGAPTSPVLTGR